MTTTRMSCDSAELRLTDLFVTGAAIAGHLRTAVRHNQWLDAYLLSCGLGQIVDDQTHADRWELRRTEEFLRSRSTRAVRIGSTSVGVLAGLVGLADRTAARRKITGRYLIASLQNRLADLVLDSSAGVDDTEDLEGLADRAIRAIGDLGPEVQRLPTSFRDFDQHPDDLCWLANAYLAGRRPGKRPVAVVGIRTSGCYLAPLLASALRLHGIAATDDLTYRPGRPFRQWERRTLRRFGVSGGDVLIIDDPPGTGSALARGCTAVAKAGIPQDSIVAVFGCFPGDDAFPALKRTRIVAQRWEKWAIHQRLTAAFLQYALGRLLGRVVSIQDPPAPLGHQRRGHAAVRFSADVSSSTTGMTTRREFVAEGVGIGYFGRHVMAVGEALSGYVPSVYGIVDGILFRDWLPQGDKVVGPGVICTYVLERSRNLPAQTDPTPAMRGRDPVWETAASTLAGPFGPIGPVARALLLEPMTRRLLGITQPSIIDGDTRPGLWVGAPGDQRKVDFDQRVFSHLEQGCYDHVFDLAGAAAAPGSSSLGVQLRAVYRERTGRSIDAERWLLHRLVHLRSAGKSGDLDAEQIGQASAEAVYDFLAECFPPPAPNSAGPLCAIDLDGVLETDRLGYPATSPLGLVAIRSLQAHGFRPIIATGRSLSEAVRRSSVLGLDAAVAEYGAAIWVGGSELDLRTDEEAIAIKEARERLGAPSIALPADYRHVIRASWHGGPLPADIERTVWDLEIRTIRGDSQTDIVPLTTTKGRGLDAVSAALGHAPWALAVGDGAEDLPMFSRAEFALAPGNASAMVRKSGVAITSGRYQVGLAEAVGRLLGHGPGRCPVCRPPDFGARTRPLLALLALSEAGSRGFAPRALHATAEVIRFCSGDSR